MYTYIRTKINEQLDRKVEKDDFSCKVNIDLHDCINDVEDAPEEQDDLPAKPSREENKMNMIMNIKQMIMEND